MSKTGTLDPNTIEPLTEASEALKQAEALVVPSATVGTDDDLPEGWVLTTIGTACILNPGKPAADKLPPDAPVSFVPMPAVDAELGAITERHEKLYHEVRGGYTAFADGDVIFAKITPCMENGKAAVAQNLTNGLGFGSSEFHVLRPNGVADANYLFHFLRQESFRQKAREEMTGSVGQARVPAEFLREHPLPLPPLAEQQRIVEAVQAALAHVNTAREQLARVPKILSWFRKAVLASACSGRLTSEWRESALESGDRQALGGRIEIPEGWPVAQIRSIVSSLDQGWSPKCYEHPVSSDGTWGVLKTTAIGAMKFDGGANKELPPDLAPRPTLELLANDLLITRAGPRSRCAVCCLVRMARPKLMICDKMYRIRTKPELCDPAFLEIILNCQPALDLLDDMKTGISDSGLNLTQAGFLAIDIPLPSLAEQKAIIRRVERLFALADLLEKRVASATVRVEKTTQAVLAKAFRGELVPTEAELARQEGRDYESASVLLERIKSERGAESTIKARRG